MATIALYSGKINQMPGFIKDIKTAVSDYKSELSVLKTKTLSINQSVCNMDDVINAIRCSSQLQESKIISLDTFSQGNEEFVSDVICIDSNVADIVRRRKENFYKQYVYLNPEHVKNGCEKLTDNLKNFSEWCKEKWSFVEIMNFIKAIVLPFAAFEQSGSAAVMGALIGAVVGNTVWKSWCSGQYDTDSELPETNQNKYGDVDSEVNIESGDVITGAGSDSIINSDENNTVVDTDGNTKGVLLFPQPGDTITISKGTDLPKETAVVSSWNTWSREYSVEGCNKKFAGQLCCRRLNYAIEHYECNSTDNDLLMFYLDGYDEAVFAGAMVEGYADIGDIVQITLDDNNSFYFLILDVKSTQHTSQELSPNNQCQCEWGHGYLLDGGKVQLSICEFITAGNCSEANVQNTESGAFLKKRSVVKAEIVDHIEIGD